MINLFFNCKETNPLKTAENGRIPINSLWPYETSCPPHTNIVTNGEIKYKDKRILSIGFSNNLSISRIQIMQLTLLG